MIENTRKNSYSEDKTEMVLYKRNERLKALVKAVLPGKAVQNIRQFLLTRREWRRSQANAKRSASDVFSEIYARNLWGGNPGDFHSGAGTHGPAASLYLSTINAFIKKHHVLSVVDIGCGDYEIGSKIEVSNYTGIDVVPALTDRNNAVFGSETRQFMCLDAAGVDQLPSADLCLIRQVMQHLSNTQIKAILRKLDIFKYVIVTEHQPSEKDYRDANRDKAHGDDTRLYYGSGVYLDQPPFNLQTRLLAEYPGDPTRLDVHERGPIRTFLVNKGA